MSAAEAPSNGCGWRPRPPVWPPSRSRPLSIFAVDDGDFAGLVPVPYVARLEALAARLRTLARLDDGEALVLVLRLSHSPPPTTRSLRIPLDSVLLGDRSIARTD